MICKPKRIIQRKYYTTLIPLISEIIKTNILYETTQYVSLYMLLYTYTFDYQETS